MLHVLSFFRSEAVPPTRFENCEELKTVGELLNTLRKKEAELNRAKRRRGAESLDFEKYTVISGLVEQLDELINQFNEHAPSARRNEEVEAMIALVSAMENLVRATMRRDEETLRKFRDWQHDAIAKTVDWGLFVTSIATLYVMPVSFLFKVVLYFGAKGVSNKIMDSTGLSEDETRSMIILKCLQTTLHRSYINLRRTIHREFADPAALREAAERHADHDSDDDEESGLLFLLAPGVQQYVESLRGRETNAAVIEAMRLTPAEEARFKDYICPVSLMVMDIPVRLEEDYFDLESLLALQIDDEGARTNPLNRNKFYPRDIQPCRSAYRAIRETIDAVQAERQAAPRP